MGSLDFTFLQTSSIGFKFGLQVGIEHCLAPTSSTAFLDFSLFLEVSPSCKDALLFGLLPFKNISLKFSQTKSAKSSPEICPKYYSLMIMFFP